MPRAGINRFLCQFTTRLAPIRPVEGYEGGAKLNITPRCAVQDSFKHWTAARRRIDYPIRHPRPTRPANQRTSRFETRGEKHDNRNERGGMGDGGDPRRTPGLRCTLYHGGEFQADGYQRNGGRHRDGGFPPADASGLARGGVRARSRRVLPHRRVFFGSGALGGSLRGVSRLRVPRAFTLGRKPGRVRVLHRSFHVCRRPSVCGRAWPRTRVGDEARMAQALIARSRQSIVIRASTTVMPSYGYWQRRFGGDRSVLPLDSLRFAPLRGTRAEPS